ncbi:MAG: nucleotidyltransferase domain-containing protein [Treponema sp.]|nr:nucleotidyltransferase domain-containing protein [Treponema sp.]
MFPTAINNIKDEILNTVEVSKIYLFGSYARGTQTAQSDYDFFVVIPNGSIRPIEAMQKIYCSLAKYPMPVPVDILASYEKDFEERKTLSSSMERTIQNEGVLLYGV